ncbi:hypothetical protein [Synechococcus sp. PCC 6312]|uniref:hypothetical protein n=1 Tax=Synechococcus sp. (strain ATCC 27167 / PCC 6312) TaxID=195253 RepID=UPI00029F12A1|nr:hypothetical protein [Synechococcus sp. PCC 6312]AFY61882.1 hypothetical protein Syn6312_2805 [Synechococcus sp. PCC 6312]
MKVFTAQAKENRKTIKTPEICAVNTGEAIRIVTQLFPNVSEVKVKEKELDRPTRVLNLTGAAVS